MDIINELLIYSTLGLYAIAAIFYYLGNKNKINLLPAAFGLAIVALGFNFLSLFIRTVASGRLPLHNGYEFVLCFTFFTVLMYLFYEKYAGDTKAGTIVMLVSTLLYLSIPLLMPYHINYIGNVMPALKSPWLAVHVITAIVAYCAFALAAGLAFLQIKNKTFTKDNYVYRIVITGFATLSLSIVLGAIWAEQAWGRYWSWDPKETWALVTWIVYAIYLHLNRYKNWQGSRANILVIVGFIIVLFTFFGVNYLLSGLHSYA